MHGVRISAQVLMRMSCSVCDCLHSCHRLIVCEHGVIDVPAPSSGGIRQRRWLLPRPDTCRGAVCMRAGPRPGEVRCYVNLLPRRPPVDLQAATRGRFYTPILESLAVRAMVV